ncbi:arylsulfotransferase family protein [Ruegeria arenilitoris]|uniref:arylsulfotransferase family protein n=1 Tax=Ruegeria arenilitoris TaxID=1173585 RepID=UPI001479E6A4
MTNKAADSEALIMLVGFFDDENQVRVIHRDGSLKWKWSLNYFDHFPVAETRVCDVETPLRLDIHGAHITPEGEVLANYEYCGTVKVDRCSGLVWSISKPTHHSLVKAENGGYWILGRHIWKASEFPDRFPPFSTAAKNQDILEDTLMRVSEDGEIIEEFSIPQLLVDNGMLPLLTANGENFTTKDVLRSEIVHANQANELPAAMADAFPLFEAGDIVISMRQLNLVVVLDPENRIIKWHQTGPWLRQHDAEFRPDGRLSIFNNNVFRTAYSRERTRLDTPFKTNIIVVDPVTRTTEVVFGEQPDQKLLSVIRGQHQIVESDGVLITEFDAGRVLEIDRNGQVVWEYVNDFDENNVGEITNAAILPLDYFKTELAPCTDN